MTWTPPTVSDFKTRFPAFVTVDDATVQFVLEEGTVEVTRWIDADKTPGVLYFAAHQLAMQGLGVGAGGSGAAITGPIKRRKVGDVETEFAGTASGASSSKMGTLGTTVYGQRYWELKRRNFAPVLVV